MNPATATAQEGFTAARYAAAFGCTPAAMRKRLREVPPSGCLIISGNVADAWTVGSLPAPLREALNGIARRAGNRDADQLLRAKLERWHPTRKSNGQDVRLRLEDVASEELDGARKLHQALLPSLQRQSDPDLSSEALKAAGVADYQAVFGAPISPRHWWTLFKRVLERDRGLEEYERLELYLPERPALRQPVERPRQKAWADELADIGGFIAGCRIPAAPSTTELRGIWTLAFEHYGRLTGQGHSPKAAARRLRDYLFTAAPFLAPSREALLKAFARKLAKWQAASGQVKALQDERADNGQRWELPEADRDALVARAVFQYRGDIAPAWRDLLVKGFSEETRSRYFGRGSRKSFVPDRIREDVSPEVEILTVMHQGPRAWDSIKGHVTRSYAGIHSLQCLMADDFTMPVYFYVPDGHGWFNLVRGQCLIFIDFRSLRVLGWSLQPDAAYSSLAIRSLCTHIFSAPADADGRPYGLPELLYFERGIWKTATLLHGKQGPFGFSEISQGLREFGIQFLHAIRPRSKTVERVGGLLQDLMEAEPGYCGRDERKDAPESLRPQMAAVAARNQHPAKWFYSFEQWNARLGDIIGQYNAAEQQGHVLEGRSPDQAFDDFMDRNNPPVQFDARLRYLLAHDKRKATVTLNGVTIRVGKQPFNYRGQEIAHLINREVLAWFDPENPDYITLTDLDRTPESAVCVARSKEPNALESFIDPDAGVLASELKRIEDQASYMKARFTVLKTKFALPERRPLPDRQTVELGERLTQQRTEAEAADRSQQREHRARRQAEQALNIATLPTARLRPTSTASLRELQKLLAEDNPTPAPNP